MRPRRTLLAPPSAPIWRGRVILSPLIQLRNSYWYMWPDAHRELEVVEGGQQGGLPTFGLRAPYTNEVVTSGWVGIIPPRVYRGIGFGPAKVKQAPGGFVITRWTFLMDGDRYHTSIQKINEFVRADGDYKRTVLARIDPRRVPALWFPTFE